MKQIKINNFKEKLYYEKLENGLEVFLVPLKNKNNYTCMLGTKYGGRNITFKINDKKVTTPTGIAHFLEHKMFEKEENPFLFYQKTGTEVNASTSHDYTSYYITGNKYYNKNLTYLLNWIKKLEITEELVKKEQGIILEEANMYKDSPARVLNEKTKENIFLKDPYRNKVIGTDEDIMKITKAEIELCYKSFYTPENMFLISVGNFDHKKALEIIKENNQDFKNQTEKIEKYYEPEPDEILNEYEEIKLNTDTPRIAVAYKINKEFLKDMKISHFETDLYLHMLINIGLGTTSEIREKWLKEKLFVSTHYKVTEIKSHYIIEFIAISNNPDKFKEELEKYLKDIKIDIKDFEREKKIWISSEVKSINNIHNIAYNILDDILDYEQFIPNKIEVIKSLNFETLKVLKEKMKFNNKVVVKILPNQK